MSKQAMGTGFRYTKIMAWAPAILMMFGVLLLAMGSLNAGITMGMAGAVFGVVVKRRARRQQADAAATSEKVDRAAAA
jgi:hypothetical protein